MLKKYEFTDIEEFQGLIGDKELFNTPIILGKKLIEEGEYDDEGNIIKVTQFIDQWHDLTNVAEHKADGWSNGNKK